MGNLNLIHPSWVLSDGSSQDGLPCPVLESAGAIHAFLVLSFCLSICLVPTARLSLLFLRNWLSSADEKHRD